MRRASSGCVEEGVVVCGLVGVTEARSVSCRPGAEGAPRERSWVEDLVVVLVVEVACEEGGTTRRDWAC